VPESGIAIPVWLIRKTALTRNQIAQHCAAWTNINGATIVQIPSDTVEYWHVELAAHSIILAEGLQAETYLDTSNRSALFNC
jgi:hypothetical protein